MDEGQVLGSWKEISAFLNRDIRTCQRWERELGLPIHRLDDSPRARVLAYRNELDAWLEKKLHEHDPPLPSSPGASAHPHPSKRWQGFPRALAISLIVLACRRRGQLRRLAPRHPAPTAPTSRPTSSRPSSPSSRSRTDRVTRRSIIGAILWPSFSRSTSPNRAISASSRPTRCSRPSGASGSIGRPCSRPKTSNASPPRPKPPTS